MANEEITATTNAIGDKIANEVIARRQIARQQRAAALNTHLGKLELNVRVANVTGPLASSTSHTAGFLVAAGDSWFDYPIHDVLGLLEDNYGYNIESSAHRGDAIESMAYQEGQLDKFARCLEKVRAQGGVPKAVLLSGGGNDIAGDEFGMLLNNATSPIRGWNADVVDGVLNQRVATAYRSIIQSIDHLCTESVGKVIPIVVHGYDYPIPDGRGFLGGWPFPGPWLEPGFREKLFKVLSENKALMHDIIDGFNGMLVKLARDPAYQHVHYLDLRNTLSGELDNDAYQAWWANELHPSHDGFTAVAAKFASILATL